MEELRADRIEEYAHRLAHHFGEAMDNQRAMKYSTIAGDHALRMYANNEAADHYGRAIQLAKTVGDVSPDIFLHLCAGTVNALQEAARFEDLGRAYHETGDPEQALQVMLEARDLWVQVGNKPMLIDNYIGISMVHYESGNLTGCLETTKYAAEMSEEIGNLWGLSGALAVSIIPHLDRGEIERAIDNGVTAIALVGQIGMGFFELAERAITGWCCGTIGLFDRGLEFLDFDRIDSDEAEFEMGLYDDARETLILARDRAQ